MQSKTLVCGAGGFIGGHLVGDLLRKGHAVRAVDIKPLKDWQQVYPDAENLVADLSRREVAFSVVSGTDTVYNLACDMGGIGFIETNKAACMLNVLINTHLLIAAGQCGVEHFFFASSACVYNADKQAAKSIYVALKESDAYPAMPEDGYGWEKLFSERMCRHYREDGGVETCVARLHNVYGPCGTFHGGREKAPAAMCRKIIHAKLSGETYLEIWGDGEQTRSFMFIDDCIKGIDLMMAGDIRDPLNLGSSEGVSINRLADIVEEIAGVKLKRRYNLDAPKGVNGRNSDNTLVRQLLNWEPATKLRDGMEKTYRWIYDQMVGQYPRPV
jgi:nucleoside-diphosphate-sugar epimerase